jgi:hypothetical protein
LSRLTDIHAAHQNPSMSHHLARDQIRSFEENGYLAIEGLLLEADLAPLEEEYGQLLDGVAADLYARGEITSRFEALAFGRRFGRILGEFPELHRYFNISLPLINGEINEAEFVMHDGPAAFGLLRNRKLLDVAESLLGGELTSNPVQQVRMKPPLRSMDPQRAEHSNVGATTWHQDTVALTPDADETRMLTIWVAMTEASVENGCLMSIPGSHKGGTVQHCPGKRIAAEMYVPDVLIGGRKPQPLPLGKGGVILFDKNNIHCALPNRSDGLRWSFDLRYSVTGDPTGRPAFPGFVARSRANPVSELRDPVAWKKSWATAREAILSGAYEGPIFEQKKWEDGSDMAICA